MKITKLHKKVAYHTVTEDEAGQRIDNFLINTFKTVPKTHVYKIIRKGEVRVNKKRVNASYKLLAEDTVRLPPVSVSIKEDEVPPSQQTAAYLKSRIVYEDDDLFVLNKPSGMSVHAGSTVRMGVVEAFKHLYPKLPNLELAHRLDAETSGCLIIAKKKRVLRELHTLLREGLVNKIYWALTKGIWKKDELSVALPLQKEFRDGGKHVVKVHHQGKTALTVFDTLSQFSEASLMQATLHTGRTHQIRVHAAASGHPIAGDDRYGDADFNKTAHKLGLRRMFLHAHCVEFTLPSTGRSIRVIAPLDKELASALKAFSQLHS